MRIITPMLALMVLLPHALAAQVFEPATPAAFEPGRTSISFRLPESRVGAIGLFRFVSERTELGLIFSSGLRWHRVHYEDPEAPDARTRSLHFGAQPMLKRYVNTSETIAPYLFGGVFTEWDRRTATASVTRGAVTGQVWHAGAAAGFGVEWLPRPFLSVGSRIGLQGGYSSGTENTSARSSESGGFVETFTTNIYLRMFLP